MSVQNILYSSNPTIPEKHIHQTVTGFEGGGRDGIWTRDLNDANVAIMPGWSTRPWHFKPDKNAIKRYGRKNPVFRYINSYVFGVWRKLKLKYQKTILKWL